MSNREPNQAAELGRLEIIAARDPEILDAYDTRTDYRLPTDKRPRLKRRAG
jgi:hypothetical protein